MNKKTVDLMEGLKKIAQKLQENGDHDYAFTIREGVYALNDLEAKYELVRDSFLHERKEHLSEHVVKWIPIDEDLPETNVRGESDYLLLSFDNFPLIEVGQFRRDEKGGGAFYCGDDEKSCLSYGLFVNAWMPIIPAYESYPFSFKEGERIPLEGDKETSDDEE